MMVRNEKTMVVMMTGLWYDMMTLWYDEYNYELLLWFMLNQNLWRQEWYGS